jgi:hypothetical protein
MRPGRKWQFKSRFRRHAFGWKSQPAIVRIREAVSEIKQIARTEPIEAAEGAVTFIERLSPALENVDSSSGAIGTAVNNAIAELVPIIAEAPAAETTRAAWLERLFDAHGADQIPYIERLADHWGELCGSMGLASVWADRLIGVTRMALSPDKNVRGYFHGTSACLSALLASARYEEILELVDGDTFWPYRRCAVKALVAQGRHVDALRYAEQCRTRGRATPRSTRSVNRFSCQRAISTTRTRVTRSPRTGPGPTSPGSGRSRRSTRTSRRRRSLPTSYGSRPATKANGSQQRRRRSCSTRRSRWRSKPLVIRGH